MAKNKRARTTHRAWAIETGEADQPRHRPTGPNHRYTHCYRNRSVARNALSRFKLLGEATKKARVVRVAITVTTIGRG